MVTYDEIAGRSVARLAAMSDGIFAVGMTLLVLDLRVPAAAAVHNEHQMSRALLALLPHLEMYLMSFLTLGIFWVAQQTLHNHLDRSDRHLSWMHLGFLFAVTLMPFSTMLLAEHTASRIALLLYWLNILLLGAGLYVSWVYAIRRGLVKPEMPREAATAISRRLVVAQLLYALGAALCIFGTRWSIAFITLVQFNSIISPRLTRFLRY